MWVLLNDRFVPEDRALVSVFDRGFLYGDGLFETLRLAGGKPFRWAQHLERLRAGAEFLGIKLPHSSSQLEAFVRQLAKKNKMTEAILRVSLSRGRGRRGYSPKGAGPPTLAMSLHPLPRSVSRWSLLTSTIRLPAQDPLARFKTANKLPQILARMQADAAGADEALLLNTDGYVAEGAGSNVFWVEKAGRIVTAPARAGILPGVTRAVLFEIGKDLGLEVSEAFIRPGRLRRAEGVFLSLSSLGVVEAVRLDGRPLKTSPLCAMIQRAYRERLRLETDSTE